jgi:hypothetical protein
LLNKLTKLFPEPVRPINLYTRVGFRLAGHKIVSYTMIISSFLTPFVALMFLLLTTGFAMDLATG